MQREPDLGGRLILLMGEDASVVGVQSSPATVQFALGISWFTAWSRSHSAALIHNM